MKNVYLGSKIEKRDRTTKEIKKCIIKKKKMIDCHGKTNGKSTNRVELNFWKINIREN